MQAGTWEKLAEIVSRMSEERRNSLTILVLGALFLRELLVPRAHLPTCAMHVWETSTERSGAHTLPDAAWCQLDPYNTRARPSSGITVAPASPALLA